VSLDASHMSEGISPSLISSIVGFGSFGTSPPLQINFGDACLDPQLRLEGSS
jgi:hypothetical protein